MMQPIAITVGTHDLQKLDEIKAVLKINRSAAIRWVIQNIEFVPPTVKIRPGAYGEEDRNCEQQTA